MQPEWDFDWTSPEWHERYQSASERDRIHRWTAAGRAKVVDPARGCVIVPCRSQLAALMCAGEVWGCDWLEIRDAAVLWCPGKEGT